MTFLSGKTQVRGPTHPIRLLFFWWILGNNSDLQPRFLVSSLSVLGDLGEMRGNKSAGQHEEGQSISAGLPGSEELLMVMSSYHMETRHRWSDSAFHHIFTKANLLRHSPYITFIMRILTG